jgi:hypothetical protein
LARAEAARRFVAERKEEGPRAFAAMYRLVEPQVRGVLEVTGDLGALTGALFRDDPDSWGLMRYFCAPPISEEDLWTLAGRKFKRVPPDVADTVAAVLLDVLDPIRFPWVKDDREPTHEERESAVMATSSLSAYERLRTQRRGTSSTRQEAAVGVALEEAGYTRDDGRSDVWVLDELDRGCFSRERKVAGAKCDVPVRLRDGRLLAVECKISNGPKNSWKRLNREVGGKAERWRQRFGGQVLTAAVLGGVFDLSCLQTAQADGVCVFWEHDLEPLKHFASDAQ